jgi:hypothetical protein
MMYGEHDEGVCPMAQPATTIDITDLPELRRIVEEVRATRQPRVLRAGNEDVAVLTPLLPARSRRRRGKTKEDYDAALGAFGGWKDLVDAEQLKADLKAARGSNRPPVELDL